ncbi:hypothetical protein [Arthrobacter sp. JSM 101049]|uniref:hypothetical protein n=1 Tax=Arthrobacter sp. JSM 101049 TaxID=929097 RepID=UPI003563FE79
MDDEIELISDGDGLAVIGDPAAVDRFLTSEGLPSKDLGLQRLKPVLRTAAGAANAGAGIAAASGRWVKLTQKSAEQVKKYGLMKGSHAGVGRAVVTENGKIKGILEIAKGPGSFAANPGLLTGAAGIMAQLAMQQTMDEITDYLATIDEKVDSILRAQKDAVLADMIGVGSVIDEALAIREHVGWVSEVTWSKVQATSMTVHQTQSYALRQLEALAEKLERNSKMGDLAKATMAAESAVQEWLAVLARCFQLQDAITLLELDRVLRSAPEEVESHRVALRSARSKRLELIARSTERLLTRLDEAAGRANDRVLLHPTTSRSVVDSSNQVRIGVLEFHGHLGIEQDRQAVEAKGWMDAAMEVKDKAFEAGAGGIEAARQLGNEAFGRAKTATDKLSNKIAGKTFRRRSGDDERAEGS